MRHNFNVGDRVVVNQQYGPFEEDGVKVGSTGTVVEVDDNVYPIGVRIDGEKYIDFDDFCHFEPHELDVLDENYPAEVPC